MSHEPLYDPEDTIENVRARLRGALFDLALAKKENDRQFDYNGVLRKALDEYLRLWKESETRVGKQGQEIMDLSFKVDRLRAINHDLAAQLAANSAVLAHGDPLVEGVTIDLTGEFALVDLPNRRILCTAPTKAELECLAEKFRLRNPGETVMVLLHNIKASYA